MSYRADAAGRGAGRESKRFGALLGSAPCWGVGWTAEPGAGLADGPLLDGGEALLDGASLDEDGALLATGGGMLLTPGGSDGGGGADVGGGGEGGVVVKDVVGGKKTGQGGLSPGSGTAP